MSAQRLGPRERSLLGTLYEMNHNGYLPTRAQLIVEDNGGSRPYTRTMASRWEIVNRLVSEGMIEIVRGSRAARLMIRDAGLLALGRQ